MFSNYLTIGIHKPTNYDSPLPSTEFKKKTKRECNQN